MAAAAEESSNRMQNLKRAFVKAVDRSFPSSANHFQLSLNSSDTTAKELLGTMIPDPKSQAGRTTLHVLADLYAQSTTAIKKVSEVRVIACCGWCSSWPPKIVTWCVHDHRMNLTQ